MSNDYDRIRLGIEFMTAYTTDNAMLAAYVDERRREDPAAAEHLMDGTAALCAYLLRKLANDTGTTEHTVLQELARAAHRNEQRSQE
ncbi:hypothetical protein [Streptomyces sp. cg35]|uniref:hypothetical protein n=1 Tax=Streptomyces sp. cg35 TaxID=3421650 RepID=UPI003D17F14F